MIDWDGCLFFLPKYISPNQCVPYFTSLKPFGRIWEQGWIFWSLSERYSGLIAISAILIYGVLYALFLQPYLGDAARYFRNSPGNVAVRREIRKQSVDTLHALHASDKYDRIIVRGACLGTVVAYDMLRAYFSRICNNLPDPATLGAVGPESGRHRDRQGRFAGPQNRRCAPMHARSSETSRRRRKAKLGRRWRAAGCEMAGDRFRDARQSPDPRLLSHVLGNTYDALEKDFERRVREREFPPARDAARARRASSVRESENGGQEFHHGAVFGLTRWTNLYFPLHQLFWGDAIGGPLAQQFRFAHRGRRSLHPQAARTRLLYPHGLLELAWPGGRQAPQILALQAAINLDDK